MTEQQRTLPIFPLPTVLFPFKLLPLQIFEERYKVMLRDCQEADSRFGVALIKEGVEVGGPATPYDVGTTARIRRVQQTEDGRYALLCMGERRFRIDELLHDRPYLRAHITAIEESQGEPPYTQEEIREVQERLAPYMRSILGLRGGWSREVDSPSSPIDLSFHIASVIRGDNEELQQVLETSTARDRLALLLPIVERETRANQEEIRRRFTLDSLRLS